MEPSKLKEHVSNPRPSTLRNVTNGLCSTVTVRSAADWSQVMTYLVCHKIKEHLKSC
jgi:hypothetical protein